MSIRSFVRFPILLHKILNNQQPNRTQQKSKQTKQLQAHIDRRQRFKRRQPHFLPHQVRLRELTQKITEQIQPEENQRVSPLPLKQEKKTPRHQRRPCAEDRQGIQNPDSDSTQNIIWISNQQKPRHRKCRSHQENDRLGFQPCASCHRKAPAEQEKFAVKHRIKPPPAQFVHLL